MILLIAKFVILNFQSTWFKWNARANFAFIALKFTQKLNKIKKACKINKFHVFLAPKH